MNGNNLTIEISEKDLDDLKGLYSNAPDGGTFYFKGREILKGYAKYLIEYLDERFKDAEKI